MLPGDKSKPGGEVSPRLKLCIAGANASTASAVSGPTPGIVCNHRAVSAVVAISFVGDGRFPRLFRSLTKTRLLILDDLLSQ